jgi:hypothetical protein
MPIKTELDGSISTPHAQRIASDCANQSTYAIFSLATPETPLGLACESFKRTYNEIRVFGTSSGQDRGPESVQREVGLRTRQDFIVVALPARTRDVHASLVPGQVRKATSHPSLDPPPTRLPLQKIRPVLAALVPRFRSWPGR